jgi:hypothetical protein
MTGARKHPDQQFFRLCLLLLQHFFDCRIVVSPRLEQRNARRIFDSDWLEHVEVPIDEMMRSYFSTRPWIEVAEKIERTILATGVEPVRGAGEKSHDVRFVEAVQIDYKVKLAPPHLFYQFDNASD